MGTRGSGLLARGLDCGILLMVGEEMEGDMVAVLGGIGPGGRRGGDIADGRGEDEAIEEGLRNDVSKEARTSSSSSSRNITDGMDGDGCRTDELYERSVVEAHALTFVAGGRNEDEAWVKLAVDAERVPSSSSSSTSSKGMARDEGVATEDGSSVTERGSGESTLSSVDGISGGEGRGREMAPKELIDGITEGTCDNAGLTGRTKDLAGEFS